MASAANARPSITRIERNGFIADIYVSESSLLGSQVYHYIIQRADSPEILHWGQEVSQQRALECVNDFIDKRQSKSAFPAMWG